MGIIFDINKYRNGSSSQESVEGDDFINLEEENKLSQCQCTCVTFYVTATEFICASCGLIQVYGDMQ